MNKLIKFLNHLPKIDGKVWVTLWGLVALYRFAVGLHIDPIYLGVLGIYAGTRAVQAAASSPQGDKDE